MLLKKVRKTIEKGKLLKEGDTVICTISGGADSVCLLHILNELKSEYNLNIYAANVNHLMRGNESDRDSEFVKRICKQADIECYYREYDVRKIAKERKLGEEECGRILRYEFFEELSIMLGNAKIATAHNLNDNAETVLFKLVRGTSAVGLSGIPVKRGKIIRPLIDVNRCEIEEYLKNNGITWCEDSSNKIPKYSRNKLRLNVIPQLNEVVENAEEHIVAAAQIIADDELYLARLSDNALKMCFFNNFVDVGRFLSFDISLQRRMSAKILSFWGVKEVTFEKIEDFISLFYKDTGKMLSIDSENYIEKSYNKICVRRNAKVSADEIIILKEGTYFFNNYNVSVNVREELPAVRNNNISVFDADKISFPLTVRCKKNGDKMMIKGMSGHKKVSDIFTDVKIERLKRNYIPLVLKDDEIICLCGIRQSALFTIDNNTKNYLIIDCQINE